MRRVLGLILLLCTLAACGKAPLHQQEAFVFGTRVEIIVAGREEATARPAINAVLREFDRLHGTYHAWEPSELQRLNATIAAGRSATVTTELAAILTDAQRFSALGDGLFDPGIGRLISLWGFQADDFKAVLPAPSALAEWRSHRPGIADLKIDGLRVTSSNRRVAIDLGGYLKGYALDRAASILREHGINNALINIGGNIMALGTKNGEAWRIGIQHPRKPGPIAVLALRDGEAVGTSGDYQRFFEIEGRRYCHLLDPTTGEPVQHTQALTVLIPARTAGGTLSDMASKPLFIAGERWRELAGRLSVDHVMRVDSSGRVQVSPALQKRFEQGGKPPEGGEIASLGTSPASGIRGIP